MSRPSRRQMLASVGSALTIGLAGCAGGGGGEESTPTDTATATPTESDMETPTETDTPMAQANVRVAHFSPDAPNVDVYLNDERVLSDVPFRAVSDYLQVPVGTHTVKITAAGDESTVAFEGDVTVEEADYTIAAVGELTSEDTQFQPLVLEDDNSDVGDGMARVRAVHASPDAPAVDITLKSSGDAIFDGVPFGESGYVEVPAGTYTLQIRGDTESNDGSVVAEFPVQLTSGTVYTAFAGGYLSPDDEPTDEAFDLTYAVDSGAGGGGPLDSVGYVRVSHFSPDAPNVDVYLNDTMVLSDVPFRASSGYLTVPTGTHTVKITAAGDESTVAFEGDVTVEEADYTIAAVGELTSEDTQFQPLVLEDDNSDPGENMARVRVVHASPDAPAVDVTTSPGSALFDGVAFGESGAGTVEAGDYNVQIRGDTDGNDGDAVADFDLSLSGGTVYTAFAGGYLSPDDEPTDAAFDLTVEQDASY